VVADKALEGLSGLVAGANRPDTHIRGVQPGRDFQPEWADIRSVEAGDTCAAGGTIRIETAIEVANIFKLGTRYSEPLEATYLDEAGKEQLVIMGSYGLGPARVLAAAVEQFADEKGIAWPRALAPFDVELLGLGKEGEDAVGVTDGLYEELGSHGLNVLYDDRDMGPGQKFADSELLGCPLRVTIGRKSLESGEAEVQVRRGLEKSNVPLEGAAERLAELWRSLD
jgi:prolyl-tRNA synthetase